MNKILTLNDFDHLRDCKNVSFKEEKVLGKNFTIISYNFVDSEFWKIPLSVECRGITFDDNGNCVCRPFEKFFNLNETESTQEHSLPWNNIQNITSKIDGSMVTPVLVNNTIHFKSKKTFFSDVALAATSHFFTDVKYSKSATIFKPLLEKGITFIFEFTSQDSRIVIDYGHFPNLTLLAIRSPTGHYFSHSLVRRFAKFNGLAVVQDWSSTKDEILETAKNAENFEGFVVDFPGQKVKIKTPWYIKRHHYKTEFRVRDVAKAVLDETLDDVLGFLEAEIPEFNLDKILKIQKEVNDELNSLVKMAEDTIKRESGLSYKDFAIRYKSHPQFTILMNSFRGKDILDLVKTYYKRVILNTKPLDLVF